MSAKHPAEETAEQSTGQTAGHRTEQTAGHRTEQAAGFPPNHSAESAPSAGQSICLHVHCRIAGGLAGQQIRQIHCPAGTKAAELLRLCGEGGDLWQSKDVLMVSQGRVILADDILHEGMTLDILPLVDGG